MMQPLNAANQILTPTKAVKPVTGKQSLARDLSNRRGPPEKGNAAPAGPRNGAKGSAKAYDNLQFVEYLAGRWKATKTARIWRAPDERIFLTLIIRGRGAEYIEPGLAGVDYDTAFQFAAGLVLKGWRLSDEIRGIATASRFYGEAAQ